MKITLHPRLQLSTEPINGFKDVYNPLIGWSGTRADLYAEIDAAFDNIVLKEQSMKLPALTEMVGQHKQVYFSFYRDGELWYRAENGFEFPIPPDDMKGAVFKPEDKSIFFMRFIRKHLDYLQEVWKNECCDASEFK